MKSTKLRHISVVTRLRYGLEAALAYLLYGFFRIMPLDFASWLGGWILRRTGPHLGVSRIAQKNIEMAFPEKSADEHTQILKDMWENLGRTLAEYPHLHRIWPRITLIGGEYIELLRDDGKPGIFVAGHTGNWEAHAITAKQLGLPLQLVYRRPNNALVDGLLCHARMSGAETNIPKGSEGGRMMLRALKDGRHLGVLFDQKLREGVPVPFFGREAMTAPAIAQFAMKFDCPVVPAYCRRTKGANFEVTIFPPLDLESITQSMPDKDPAYAVMLHLNRWLEDQIRTEPAQWLWLHRRWDN